MTKRTLYLVLAILGGILPCIFFIRHFGAASFNIADFLRAVFANPAAGGFTVDLVISSFVFWVLMFQRRQSGIGPAPFLYIALNLTIGLSCALPAYLYASEPRSVPA